MSISPASPLWQDGHAASSTPVDMASLLQEVDAFLQELKALGETTHPKDLFARHGGDKFVDCVLVSERECGEHAAPVLHFDNTMDRIRHLHRTRAQWRDGAFLMHAVSRWNTRDHAIYEDLATRAGKASAVVVESTLASIGLSVLKDYIVAQRDYPDATPSVTVLVTGAQKTTYGCSAYSIGYGFDHVQADKRAGIDAIHAQHFAGERKLFQLVVDLLGTHLHWSTYRQAQSRTHIEQICAQHRLDGALLKSPECDETLLEYHDRHRVTQDVTDQESRRTMRKTFSNAVDRTRVRRLERLAAYLKALMEEHGAASAGRIFAEKLAQVRVSRPADWDAGLDELRRLLPSWDTRQGIHQIQWKAGTPAHKLAIFTALLNALPQWRAAPTVRADALAVIGAIFNDLLPQAEALEADMFKALARVPQVVTALAADVREQREFDYVLWLMYAYLHRAPRQQRSEVIRNFLALAATWARADFRAQFIEGMEACAEDDPVLLATIGTLKRDRSSSNTGPKDRYRLCHGCDRGGKTEQVELAAALDMETMDVLLNWIGYKPRTDQRVLPPFPAELRQAGLDEKLLKDKIGSLRAGCAGWLSFELLPG